MLINKLKKISLYINKNAIQILITVAISVLILYLYSNLIINETITSFIKSTLTGLFIGFAIAQLNNSKIVVGQAILNCYLGFMLSLSFIKVSNNKILHIIAYIIIIICTYYIAGVLKKHIKLIVQNKNIIIELFALIIALLALTFQILDFIR